MPDWWQVGIAIYAAVVATGALFLEVRRWFEGKPRLVVTATMGMKTMGLPGGDDNQYMLVTVSNRGAAPTTIMTLALSEFPSWWARMRHKESRAAVVPDPSITGTLSGRLPHVLGSGERWSGFVNDDDELREWVKSKRLYVAIYASHTDRPSLTLIKLPAKLPGSSSPNK